MSRFVSVAEVRQRVASVVEPIEGFREVPWPLTPDAAPAGYDTHPFAVIIAETANTRSYRDSEGMGASVRSTVVVEFLASVTPAEGSELSSLDVATEAESSVIRALSVHHGATWSHGLTIAYVTSARSISEDGGFLVVSVTFAIEHALRLA
ncbi:MAG: hypothetical protein Q8P18_18360 [Pseudomonadota bacterium]|nr:hypothetical protein [Pseudomonadota bacterium]